MPPPLGFAIVGCGMIARFHARALSEVPGAKLVALITRNPAHAQAGQLSLEEKQYAQALSECQVTMVLDPPIIAEANYNLASAYHFLGKQPEAKHAVLRALEAAPSYEKAQELLLKIVGQ